MIGGVEIVELREIGDERGKVMHMLRSDSPLFTTFGEIYFSVVNPGVVKAWKKHFKMTQRLAVPSGRIELVLFDDRDGSLNAAGPEVLEIGEGNYCLVKIPPLVWYGFRGISPSPSLIANCTDIPHDPAEVVVIDSGSSDIPYTWRRANVG